MIFLYSVFNSLPFELAIVVVIAYFLAICVAMSFHEFAHSFAAYKCGDPTPKAAGRLTLNPFAHFSGMGLLMFFLIGFGWAKPVQINPLRFRHYRKGMAWVSVSGILTNLILAFVFSGFYALAFNLGYGLFLEGNVFMVFLLYFLQYCVILNLILCFFNLLPIHPLDGFNFIATFLKYDNKFVQFMQKYGFIILLIGIIPIFGGQSIIGLFYDYVVYGLLDLFMAFWGLF